MTEREERDLAQRIANVSDIFDFDRALELVQRRPAEAEKLIRLREESRKRQEEIARARERRRRAFIEEFGYVPRRAG